MAKLPDGLVFDRIIYVVDKRGVTVWPDDADHANTTEEQAKEAAQRLGGFVMPCQVFTRPPDPKEYRYIKVLPLASQETIWIPV